MNTLVEIQKQFNFNTDKGLEGKHSYLEVYDKLFAKYKSKKINILEIGALGGESLKLWAEYFENATIYGVDIFERVSLRDVSSNVGKYKNIILKECDSFSENLMKKVERDNFLNEFEDSFFDIIIDDGHHAGTSQVKTFNNFISKLNSNGIYIIEDIKMWDGHDKHVIDNIKDLEIIDMNENYNVKDNTLGVYRNE
jgi:hypothetical protein